MPEITYFITTSNENYEIEWKGLKKKSNSHKTIGHTEQQNFLDLTLILNSISIIRTNSTSTDFKRKRNTAVSNNSLFSLFKTEFHDR